jgi:hypothetical protein
MTKYWMEYGTRPQWKQAAQGKRTEIRDVSFRGTSFYTPLETG